MSIFIASLPTTEKDDVSLAKEILLKRKNLDGAIVTCEMKLKEIFANENLFLFNRGRDGIYSVLKSLGIGEKDEVIVQAMTCVAVISPIMWSKATPVYADIDHKTFDMTISDLKKKITDKTRLVIVQHTFGNIVKMKEIRNIIDRENRGRKENKKIYILEDCAHLFPNSYESTVLNRYSDFSMYSFAQDKSISSVQGGLIVINNKELTGGFKGVYKDIPEQSVEEGLYNARYIALWDLFKKTYHWGIGMYTIGRGSIVLTRMLGIVKQQATEEIEDKRPKRMSSVQATLLLNQLGKVDKLNSQRKKIKEIYDKKLNPEYVFNTENTLLRYPILVENPKELFEIFRKEKITCGRWYSSIVFPIKKDLDKLEYKGDCLEAETVVQKIFNLPMSIDVDDEMAEKISEIVNKYGKAFKFSS